MASDRLSPIIELAVDRITSTASASGLFADVLSHEPKSAPASNGLTFATWIEHIRPIALRSGLPVTSARLEMTGRVYRSMLSDPQNSIDTEIGKAASFMLGQLTGDFGVTGAFIDLLGMSGDPLQTQFGYVAVDRTVFRIADITIPFVADDVYDQES
jgi:hypothetical protein